MDTILLAGGKSSRMGRNKALLPFGKQRVVDHLVTEFSPISDEILLITNHPNEYNNLEVRIITDSKEFKGHGPLAGIYAGLKASHAEHCLVIACDMPFASKQFGIWLVNQLLNGNYDAVIPSFEGRLHPLFGAYKRSVFPFVKNNLLADKRRMTDLLNELKVKVVEQQEAPEALQNVWGRCLWNMNTIEEYKQALRFANEEGEGNGLYHI
ncbi:putative molybdenum cofactor guanylyltransferase [Heyndrickxia sporothermodurans]|nr:putative molybdenum cofactor guanylyltransferase [Heyndrickxia sporothermodurans]